MMSYHSSEIFPNNNVTKHMILIKHFISMYSILRVVDDLEITI